MAPPMSRSRRGRAGQSINTRGRGRGGPKRGRGRQVFDSARIAQKLEDDEDAGSDLESNSEQEGPAENQSQSSREETSGPPEQTRSYALLKQNFTATTEPQFKKRKFEHQVDDQPREPEVVLLETSTDDPDAVLEAEDGGQTSAKDVADDVADSSDPFISRFVDPDDNDLKRALESVQQENWKSQRSTVSGLGVMTRRCPIGDAIDCEYMVQPIFSPQGLKLKEKLLDVMDKRCPSFNFLESHMAPVLSSYQDVLYCERTPNNASSLRRLVCLHALNHIFKTRDRVIKNNARLAKEQEGQDLDLRDQGFTRPKVLIIIPTRQSCVLMVKTLLSLCEPEQQENRKRFDDSYVSVEDGTSTTKPEDFQELFQGNDDDMFRLGLKFTRKTIKYFSQFYSSDLILASPLGLRTAIAKEDGKRSDSDFLSSIEMVIVDQANALLMQNWEHIEYIFEHLNLQPKEAHGCDFSRVRSWYLDNNAKYFRQTIALAAFNTPEFNNLFHNHSQNWTGAIKIKGSYKGTIQELPLKVRQTFSRLENQDDSAEPDARFAYFTSAILPALTRRAKNVTGVLIFIPSYFDFVRVRDHFSTSATLNHVSFGCISEYVSIPDVARARSHFLKGRHSVLLYTERAHHFNRYQIRGVKKIIMYGLPENPLFYKEIVGEYLKKSLKEGVLESKDASVRAIFSKMDVLKLERIAGSERVSKMVSEETDTFDFS